MKYLDCYVRHAGIIQEASQEFPTDSYGPVEDKYAERFREIFLERGYDRVEIVEETLGCNPIGVAIQS